MPLTDEQKSEILDWVSVCQSAYHIDSTPGHRFGGLGSNLAENREALIECIEEYVAEIERAATAAAFERAESICNAKYERHAANGFPREASTARALRDEIRADSKDSANE